MSAPGLVFLLIWGLLIAGLIILFWHPQRSRTKANAPIDHQSTDVFFRDDNRYWYGPFYNNPDDPALFVPKRYGLGWTINFGHPQGKLVFIGMLLLPLVFGVILPLLLSGGVPIGCHTLGCHPQP